MEKQDEILNSIMRQIFRGNAILFVGAGFSEGAIGFDGSIPTANKLKEIIFSLMDEEYDETINLQFVSDFFINEYCKDNLKRIDDFIEKLKNIFTCKETQQYHLDIISAPWRHIYTTNYDDVVEQAARKTNFRVDSFDLDSSLDNTADKKYCLHINGRIDKLGKNTINSSFKLTHSSYVNSDSFNTSPWKRRFTDDLDIASVVVFIGYSIYDIDIEKVLQGMPKIRDKVFFIEKESSGSKIKDSQYEKYGKLLRIGVENFAKKIRDYKSSNNAKDIQEEFFTECFVEYSIKQIDNLETIRESEIDKFLMLGSIEERFLQRETLVYKNKPPFLVVRESWLDKAISILKEHKRLVILSDIGNGKTIFLKQLATKLTQEYKVYYLKNRGDSALYKKDIDKIAQQNEISYVIIDSYLRYLELVDFIFLQKYPNIKTVLSARTLDHYQYIRDKDDEQEIPKLLIDTLDDNEVGYFCDILDTIGIWTESSKTNWSLERKKNHIQEECYSQISYILVDILKAKQMADKIKDLVSIALKDDITKRHLFVILLLNVMDIPMGLGLLEQLLGEYNLSIFQNDIFTYLVHCNLLDRDNEIQPKSSIFSRFVLQSNIFEPQYIIKESLDLLIRIENLGKNNLQYSKYLNDVRINLFRFNFIERILPENNKKNMLVQYYENIKNEIPRIQHDPQYYLQYATCFIANNDFEKAQRYLKIAYDKSKETTYDTYKIDNQQARLYLLQSARHSTNIKEAIEHFLKADELLTKRHKDDIYKYKTMLKYKDFIENRCTSFDKNAKDKIRKICENQLKAMANVKGFETDRQDKTYMDCKAMLEKIIDILT